MPVHEKPVGATVEWYTPPSLFESLLGPVGHRTMFELDPACSGGEPCAVPAVVEFTPADDGLARDWSPYRRLWLNPPYGPAGVPFIERMLEHGDGLMLLPSRTETAIYQRSLASAEAVCFLRDRLHFIRSDGFQARAPFGSTLFAFGDWAADVLVSAGLGWTDDHRHQTRALFDAVRAA